MKISDLMIAIMQGVIEADEDIEVRIGFNDGNVDVSAPVHCISLGSESEGGKIRAMILTTSPAILHALSKAARGKEEG